jgi:hypothetical protein
VETLFSNRINMIELVQALVSFKHHKKDPLPVYLHKFLEFCLNNLNQYSV